MFFVVLMLFGQAPPIDLGGIHPDATKPIANYYHGQDMKPACSSPELERLRIETTNIMSNGGDAAWALAYTMLCGTSVASKHFLNRHIPDRVLLEVYPEDADGGVSQRLVERAQVQPIQGLAWSVSVYGKHDELIYGYNSDELCGGSFKLRNSKGTWLLVGITEACD